MNKKQYPAVRVLKVGTIRLEGSEMASMLTLQIKSEMGIGGGSTVTLIKGEKNILVDTGFEYEWLDTVENKKENARNLVRNLRDYGLKPEDIDIVFITHWHLDHYGNSGVFKKATCLVSKPLAERHRNLNLVGINDGGEIAKGVRVIYSPGHTIDHASLVVETAFKEMKVRVAVAGDAVVSYSYFVAGRIWKYNADFYNEEVGRKSMSLLRNAADIIIPGHSVPFLSFQPRDSVKAGLLL
jgi:glyoxylase-like metal-dependent hydrolase (beta-lactamase superfamily II)